MYQEISIDTNVLLAMLKIIDKFEIFTSDLSSIMKKHLIDFEKNDFEKLLSGEYFDNEEVKHFKLKYKNIINIIINNCSLYDFACYIYDYFSYDIDENSELVILYKMLINKYDINKVMKLIECIQKLGFEKINYSNDYSFCNDEYSLKIDLKENNTIRYFDNLIIIPSYLNKSVKYKTLNSKYMIVLVPSNIPERKNFKEIYLNDLCFDVDVLPKSISIENIINIIITKGKNNKESIFLTKLIDMKKIFDSLNEDCYDSLNKINKISDEEELRFILKQTKDLLTNMQNIINDYKAEIYSKYDSKTVEQIRKEIIKQKIRLL